MQRRQRVIEHGVAPGGWLVTLGVTPLAQLQVICLLAIALGGGGVAYGLRNAVIQLAALVVLWLNRMQVWRFVQQGSRGLLALVALSLALPLVQLVPLPPALWQGLPGRGVVVQAFAIAGLPADSWFPLSLDRGRTLTAFCGLLAPAALVAVGAGLAQAQRAQLARTIAWGALAALALGMVQLASANTSLLLFALTAKPDVLYATFANRNSTALLLVLALILLAAAPLPRSRAGLLGGLAGAGLLALGVVLTQSRSGMVLGLLALAFVAARAGAWRWRKGLLVAGLALAVAAVALLPGGRVETALARFDDGDTTRPQLWEDTAFAASTYWPVGSGMGTFDEVFQLHESLEYLSPRRAGRAHNDWLELALEAGLAGLALALAWLGWVVAALWRAPSAGRWLAAGAGLGASAIALQSLLDYPLRNQTLLCVAAVLAVLLARPAEQAR